MKNLLKLIVLVSLLLVVLPSYAQTDMDDMAAQTYVEANRALIDQGLRPLGRSEILDQVAQEIADELSATGTYASLPRVLADTYGYPRWPDNGQRVLSDAINLIGVETPTEFAAIMQPELVDVISRSFYREMGVGYATRVAVEGGTEQNVYVLVLGAQPNVLPVVIGDGADVVYTRDVEVHIHNELSLAYQTDDDIIQRADNVRIANSEADLETARWFSWDVNNFAVPWTLTEDYGEKEVWAEFEDEKGVIVTYTATVIYADPATRSEPDTDPAEIPITLVMTYSDDTFTLQIETERSMVRLQEVYFTWLDGLRAYEIENADQLQEVDLEDFDSTTCIQIKLRRPNVSATDVAGCSEIYLEADEFTELDQVFWNPQFGTFTVFDGPRELGVCDTTADSCEIALR